MKYITISDKILEQCGNGALDIPGLPSGTGTTGFDISSLLAGLTSGGTGTGGTGTGGTGTGGLDLGSLTGLGGQLSGTTDPTALFAPDGLIGALIAQLFGTIQ